MFRILNMINMINESEPIVVNIHNDLLKKPITDDYSNPGTWLGV